MSLQILFLKRITNSGGITTRLEQPSHKSFRRHIGTLPTNDWESGLREATYQALLRENNREPTLRDQIYYAPLEGRQDSAIPFGDIIILARGQLYSTYNGFKFVQDPYQNDCDDCHNGRVRCSPSQCKGWNPVTGEQLVALWTVKRIRHRDPVYGHRYELEYTLSPISAVINSGFLLPDGGFDYNIPGHVFIIKFDPNVDKTNSHKATTATFDQGTTWFNNNYVNLNGNKAHSQQENNYKPVFTTKVPNPTTVDGTAKEIELYKELIKSLAMKTSTSLKPSTASSIYSDIFDATIQKVPVTMIHHQTSTVPVRNTPSSTTQMQITSIWSTTPQINDSTKRIKFPSTQSSTQYSKNTRYSEPDPLYHSTTVLTPSRNVQQTSKSPITTITFFAPDDSVTENEIFGSPNTHTALQSSTNSVTSGSEHADIFDVVNEESTIGSTKVQTQSTRKYSSTTTSVRTTTTPVSVTTTVKPTTIISTYGKKTTPGRKSTRRTRKPFIPGRFTKTSTVRTTQKPQSKASTRRKTTTPLESDEVFLQTTPRPSTTEKVEETSQTIRTTTPSIFDISIENDSRELEESTKEMSTVAAVTNASQKPTTEEIQSTTEIKSSSVQHSYEESEEDLIADAKESLGETTTQVTSESPLTKPYSKKYTTESGTTKEEEVFTQSLPETEKTTSRLYTMGETETTFLKISTEAPPATSSTPTTQTKPIVFVGTIVTRRPNTKTTTQPIKAKSQSAKDINHKDIYDIFGEEVPSVLEKPTTEKQSTTHVADDFLFGSAINRLPGTTQEALVIFDNFFEASTSNPNKSENITTTITSYTTQLENSSQEVKTEAEPSTSMSYITSISFQVNGKNVTTLKQPTNTTKIKSMKKAKVKEVATNATDFKVFKAQMPDINSTDAKQQFDHIALSLINHARSINILNNKNSTTKYKRRSYTPRRGRKRKVRREKMT